MFVLASVDSLSTLKRLFTVFTGWMGSLVTTISADPLLLLPVGIFVVGGVIGLASRLIGR